MFFYDPGSAHSLDEALYSFLLTPHTSLSLIALLPLRLRLGITLCSARLPI